MSAASSSVDAEVPATRRGRAPPDFTLKEKPPQALYRYRPSVSAGCRGEGLGSCLRPQPIKACPLLLHSEVTSVCCEKVQAGQQGTDRVLRPRTGQPRMGGVLAGGTRVSVCHPGGGGTVAINVQGF